MHVVVIKFLGSVLLLLSVRLDFAEVSNKLHWCKLGFWPLMLVCAKRAIKEQNWKYVKSKRTANLVSDCQRFWSICNLWLVESSNC